MKKALSVLFLIVVSLCVWASDYNVLVYPSNTEISHYIEKWFPTVSKDVESAQNVPVRYNRSEVANAGENLTTAWKGTDESTIKKAQDKLETAKESFIDDSVYNVKLVTYKGHVTEEDAAELDSNVLSYLCRTSNADLLIIPAQKRVDDLYMLTIDIWSEYLQKTERVFLEIRQNSELYSESCILALAPYFLNEEQIASFSIEKETTKIETLPTFTLTSDVTAKVWLNDKEAGITPLTLENVPLPSIIRLSAEGYSDSSMYIDGKKTEEKISMKPAWMDDSGFYKETRKKFYTDFAMVLGAFGLKVAVKSIEFKNQVFQTGANYLSTGLIAATLVNLVYGLFNYYSSAGGMT